MVRASPSAFPDAATGERSMLSMTKESARRLKIALTPSTNLASLLAPQRLVQAGEHVVKRLHSAICLSPGQFRARPFTKFRLERNNKTFRQCCQFLAIASRLAQFGYFRFQSHAIFRGWPNAQSWIVCQLSEQLNQTRGRQPLPQHTGQNGVVVVKFCAPKIVYDFMQKARLICHQLGLESHAAFECAIGQNSRAKTVDGIDRSFIKTLQREFQSALELFSVADSFDDLRD